MKKNMIAMAVAATLAAGTAQATENSFELGTSAKVYGEASGLENVFDRFKGDIQDNILSVTQNDADQFVNLFKDGRASVYTEFQAPGFSVNTESGATVGLDFKRTVGVNVGAIKHNQVVGGLLPDVQIAMGVDYIEANELTIGYGRTIPSALVIEQYGVDGELTYQFDARMINVGAKKAVYNFNDSLSPTVNVENDIEDAIDGLNSGIDEQSMLTADLDVDFKTKNWSAGASVKNIVPVTVNYQLVAASATATDISDSYDVDYEMAPYGVIRGSVYSEGGNWMLSGSLDTNAHKTIMNNDEKNLTVMATYNPSQWYVPGVRFGVNKNLAGTEFTTYHLGLRYGVAALDLAATGTSYDASKQEDFAGSARLSVNMSF